MSLAHWIPTYIGIGSNLESPHKQVESGLAALATIVDSMLVLRSSCYRSAPMGPVEQPNFINAVAAVLTRLKPHELLAKLQIIEGEHGRRRDGERWGPRTLDLDLLSCGSVTLSDDALTLPHPGIAERNFVLLPWCEIAPHYQIPGLASVAVLAASPALEGAALEKLVA